MLIVMKYLLYSCLTVLLLVACNTAKTNNSISTNTKTTANDTIRIANDSLEYEVIIIEPGFNTWLVTRARPEGFYTQSFLENKNIHFVAEWNNRVLQPQRFNPNLYGMQINYNQGIDYGYDVNYKIYNYFIYFQNKYNQNLLGGRVPLN